MRICGAVWMLAGVLGAQQGEHPVDRFVAAGLRGAGLDFAPPADRATLLRRTSLTLTGLPPTPAEVDAFVADAAPGSFERVLDRLLASPHYAEHQAARWLDLARYADTNGYEKDAPRTMWPWRDELIASFDRDEPFDRFTIRQLAGDLLPDATTADRIASGYHRNAMLNDEGGVDAEEFRVVAVKDRVDATARTWLALTLDCAQCHDHPHDPITQREYYAFYAFFDSTRDTGVGAGPTVAVHPRAVQPTAELLTRELAAARAALDTATRTDDPVLRDWLAAERTRLLERESAPPRAGPWFHLGPLPCDDQRRALARRFPAERRVDLDRRFEGLAWQPRPDLTDGIVHALPGERCVHFLFRTIDGPAGRRVTLSLGSDDALEVLWNGDEVLSRDVTRAAALDSDRVDVTLREGPDELLLKVVNGGGPGGFAFRLVDGDWSEPVRVALRKPPADRDATDDRTLAAFLRDSAPALAAQRARVAALVAGLAELPTAQPLVMAELDTPRATRVLTRGDWRQPGPRVTPDVPAVLPPFPADAPRDRLGLARWLVGPAALRTARVTANRVWAAHFGRGLVATLDDFGARGEPASHPELLDFLARAFVDSGWSLRALHRLILTSRTWQQASALPADDSDPANLRLGRGPRYRLSFEQLRDQALAAAGLLDPTVGGPSVMPPQPDGVWEQSFAVHDLDYRWRTDDPPKRHRRGIYVYLRRTAPYPTFALFDGPRREVCAASRNRTITPLQALAMWNDPAFVEAAGALATRVLREVDTDPASARPDTVDEARLARLFRLVLARPPLPAETTELLALLRDARADFATRPADAAALCAHARVAAPGPIELASWIVLANLALNLDETLTLR
ncbi:MAG: DUF1553 domain-containing protein [Planctomycetes bacterium]|nr:DUF1553 domain-containing protein [Planctomycetota bacterium]